MSKGTIKSPTEIYKQFKESSRYTREVINQLRKIELEDIEIIIDTTKEIVAFTVEGYKPEVYNYNCYDNKGHFIISFDVNSETGEVNINDNDIVYYKSENAEQTDRNVIFNSLYSCEDLKQVEVLDVIRRTDTIECEYVECKDNDNDSYNQYTFYDISGQDIITFEVYINRDYVNLLEYKEW